MKNTRSNSIQSKQNVAQTVDTREAILELGRELSRCGRSVTEVAEILGRKVQSEKMDTEKNFATHRTNAPGIHGRTRMKTEDRKQKMMQMRESGMTNSQIAKALKYTHAWVCQTIGAQPKEMTEISYQTYWNIRKLRREQMSQNRAAMEKERIRQEQERARRELASVQQQVHQKMSSIGVPCNVVAIETLAQGKALLNAMR